VLCVYLLLHYGSSQLSQRNVYELIIVRYMYTHTLFASSLFGMHELFLFLLQNSLYTCDRNFPHTPKDDRIVSECIVYM